eukprot:gene11194-15014_t
MRAVTSNQSFCVVVLCLVFYCFGATISTTSKPTKSPTTKPSNVLLTVKPTPCPTTATTKPTKSPTTKPSNVVLTAKPTPGPSFKTSNPTQIPTTKPSKSVKPTNLPTLSPTNKKISAVDLGLASSFAILSATGVTDVYASSVTGNVGSTPISGAAILIGCTEVTGIIYAVDAAGPAPCAVTDATLLGTALVNFGTAYTDVNSRPTPDFLNLKAGTLSGDTLVAGLYKWSTGLAITNDITISGSSNDTIIFQVAGTLTVSSGKQVILKGVQAKNIYWVTTDTVTLGTTSSFQGTILAKKDIQMLTGSVLNGRALAQTAVALQKAFIIKPT